MFFIDKYRPMKMCDSMYHKDILNQLLNISSDECLPNLIFYGPKQSGKKTLVNMFLEMIFDESVHKINETKYTAICSSGSTMDIKINQSNFHILIQPNNNNSDKYIVQDVIKEYAMRIPMNFFKKKKNFKIVLINDVQNLSYHAQTSLRRTMELYAKTCRFIMISSSLSKVIDPIRSRCHSIRVPSPSRSDIFRLLVKVALNEGIKLKLQDYSDIRDKCGRNVKMCLWELENIKYNIKDELDLIKRIDLLGNYLIEGSLSNLQKIRSILYGILITNFTGTEIIKLVTENLLKKIKTDYHKYMIINSACLCEYRFIMGRHEIHHLEKFIIDIYYILLKSDKKVKFNK